MLFEVDATVARHRHHVCRSPSWQRYARAVAWRLRPGARYHSAEEVRSWSSQWRRGAAKSRSARRGDYELSFSSIAPFAQPAHRQRAHGAQRVLISDAMRVLRARGAVGLVGMIKRVRAHLNPELEIAGLLAR